MDRVNSFRIIADNICNYIPLVSTVTNAVDLFQKHFILPSMKKENTIESNYYYRTIDKKTDLRCIALLVPVLGNIVVGCYDLAKKIEKGNIENLKDIPELQLTKYLNEIEEEMGVKIVKENNSLTITISDPEIPFDQLSEQMTILSKISNQKIDIKLSPKPNVDLNGIKQFMEKNGQFITLLNFSTKKVNDEIIENAINYCPNLQQLSIDSNSITGSGLENLNSLKKLTDLTIKSWNLTKLPDPLPALTTLNLKCMELTELFIPPTVKTLNLSNCSKLTQILLPPNVIDLDLSWCKGLTVEYRMSLLSEVFDDNFEQGLKLYKSFEIQNQTELGDLIAKKLSIKNITENLSKIKEELSEEAFNSILLKIIQEDFSYFLENRDVFQNISKERLETLPEWTSFNALTINQDKSSKTKNEVKFELKEIPEIELDELLELFDAINFTDKEKPEFKDPEKLTLDGAKTDVETLKEGIKLLLGYIKDNKPYTAVPSDKNARKEWYQQLTYALKRVIQLSNTSEDKGLVADELIRLGMAGHACGSRWIKEASDITNTLQGKFEVRGMNEMIGLWMDEYKEGIMQQITLDFSSGLLGQMMQPHIFNYVASVMKAHSIPLPNNMIVDLNDVYMPTQFIPRNQIEEKIDGYFTPLKLAKFIQDKINDQMKMTPVLGVMILIPFKEYAESKLTKEINDVNNSIEEKKLMYGIKEAERLLKENHILNAILQENQEVINDFKKIDRLLVIKLSNEVNAAQFNEQKRIEKQKQVSSNIANFESLLKDTKKHEDDLKNLGNHTANVRIRLEKEELVSDYLEKKNLIHENQEKVFEEIKVTLFGALTLLKHLGYLIA